MSWDGDVRPFYHNASNRSANYILNEESRVCVNHTMSQTTHKTRERKDSHQSYESLSSSYPGLFDNSQFEDVEEMEETGFKFWKLPAGSKSMLVFCTIANFLASTSISVMWTFYPLIAEEKGISIWLIGWVFGAYQLGALVSAPLYRIYLTSIGPRFLSIAGLIVAGAATILLGVVDQCEDYTGFIILSVTCRAIIGIGYCGFWTSTFAFITKGFQENIGLHMSIISDTGYSLGLLVGPVIGGILYQSVGYGYPFYVTGGSVFIFAVLTWMILPHLDFTNEQPFIQVASTCSLLRSSRIWISLLVVFVGYFSLTTFQVSFSKHVADFKLSTTVVGALFCIQSGSHLIFSPLLIYLIDAKNIQNPLIIISTLIYGFSFLILGPAIFLHFIPHNIWVTCLGLTTLGIAFGSLLNSTITCMMMGATIDLAFAVNLEIYRLVYRLHIGAILIGGFLGPVVSTYIVKIHGTEMTYTVLGCVCLFTSFICFMYFFIRNCYHQAHRNEVSLYSMLEASYQSFGSELS